MKGRYGKIQSDFKSGYVAIVGAPNVGKSTIFNCILKHKIAITSPKSQTTRNKISGILTDEKHQIIFLDTPGAHKPKNKLSQYMLKSIKSALTDADVVVYVVDCTNYRLNVDRKIINEESNNFKKRKCILVINKIDLINKENLLAIIANYKTEFGELFSEFIPISANKNDGIEILLDEIKQMLPIGPKYYPDDALTDQTERNIIAEIVRENLIIQLEDEIPFGTAVVIEKMSTRPDSNIIDLILTIYCERESHKSIIIGKNGQKLKSIATKSRQDIENFLNSKVFMDLWVKIRKDWRNNESQMRNLGYI